MFAEMLIHFCFGKFLHYSYVLFIGKVMPNFCMHGSKYSLLLHTAAQETMVRQMSEAMVARYKARATAFMIQNNMIEIRCPCRRCKLGTLIKPDSGTLEKHLLMGGFMPDYIDEDVNNGVPAGNGAHKDAEHDYDEEDAGGHDHVHHEGDSGSDGEDTDT